MRKEKNFDVTKEMFVRAIGALLCKDEQKTLMSFFNVEKKDGGDKCQLKK